MIELRGVSKSYGHRSVIANLSLTIPAGEVTLLLGPNGAGKSTLLRCLMGIEAFDGTIRVAGLDPAVDGREVRALVGYMPQSGGLHGDLSVVETIHLFADIRRVGRERGTTLLHEAGLAQHAHARVADLSGGMRQRLGFALALLSDPQILVLDEPSASLDAASREWLCTRLQAAAAEGRTVLVSTHSGQELLAAGHRRVLLEEGRVASDIRAGSPVRRATSKAPRGGRAGTVRPLILKELKDAVANRWILSYTVVLAALGTAAAATAIGSSSGLALHAYGRTTATLMNLCLLFSPLVAVLMGAAAVAGERDRGTLEHLLAQPLTRPALVLAKHTGLLIALTAATGAGFLPAALVIVLHAGPGVLGHYLLFPAIAALVGASMLALGLLISVSSRTAVQAQGAAVFVWFGFVLLYDLVLMGVLSAGGMPVAMLGLSLAGNPVDAARVLGVLSLEPDLYLLGPAGAYLTARFSRAGAACLLLASLAFWAAAPLALAVRKFRVTRRGSRSGACIEPVTSKGEVTA